MFVFCSFFYTKIIILVLDFLLDCFTLVILGAFKADYAALNLLIVEGRILTYNCSISVSFGLLKIDVS